MTKKTNPHKPARGRPKNVEGRVLIKKMFTIDEAVNEILRNVCHEYRISFSALVRELIDSMIEKKWKYFNANYRGE